MMKKSQVRRVLNFGPPLVWKLLLSNDLFQVGSWREKIYDIINYTADALPVMDEHDEDEVTEYVLTMDYYFT